MVCDNLVKNKLFPHPRALRPSTTRARQARARNRRGARHRHGLQQDEEITEIEQDNVDGVDATNNPSLEPHRRGGRTADDLEARSNLGGHVLQLPINNANTTTKRRLAGTNERCLMQIFQERLRYPLPTRHRHIKTETQQLPRWEAMTDAMISKGGEVDRKE